MCDCSCSGCCGSSHCGSCSGSERGKELRGGKYKLCDCKLRNGIQDGCSRILCKKKSSESNENNQKSGGVQRSTIKQQQQQQLKPILETEDYAEQRLLNNTTDNINQLQDIRPSRNNGLGDSLQNYNKIQLAAGPNNPMLGGYQQEQQPLYNKMFAQNTQINRYPNPPNTPSNYYTPPNQTTVPHNFPITSYNQTDLNTMLNQTQFKDPNDSINMYQGKTQQIIDSSSNQLKNQSNEIGNYGQDDSNNNNSNEIDNSKNNPNINCLPYNSSTFGSMIINPFSHGMNSQPISFQLIGATPAGVPNKITSSNSYGDMPQLNNSTNTPFIPCMTVVLNLQTKANYLKNDNDNDRNSAKRNKIIKKKFQ